MAELNVSGNTSKNYLKIIWGKVVKRLWEWEVVAWMSTRTITEWDYAWKVINELRYDSVAWYITNIYYKIWNYGQTLNICLDDDTEICFNAKQMQKVSNSLLKLDLTKKLEIQAYLALNKKTWERTDNSFSLKQWWEWVWNFVTKDEPRDCPQPFKEMNKGIEKWNFNAYEDWFYTKTEELIADKFPNGKVTTPVENQSSIEEIEEDSLSIDDIPF